LDHSGKKKGGRYCLCAGEKLIVLVSKPGSKKVYELCGDEDPDQANKCLMDSDIVSIQFCYRIFFKGI
jgi:hypothetical protein